MTDAKVGSNTASSRDIGSLRDRLRTVRKRKQFYRGLTADDVARQPLAEERRKKRDD